MLDHPRLQTTRVEFMVAWELDDSHQHSHILEADGAFFFPPQIHFPEFVLLIFSESFILIFLKYYKIRIPSVLFPKIIPQAVHIVFEKEIFEKLFTL